MLRSRLNVALWLAALLPMTPHGLLAQEIQSGPSSPVTAPPHSSPRARDRDVTEIRIEGLETISPETVHRKLQQLPEIFEAAHHSVDQATYAYRVHQAVRRGMLSSGFLDAHVELTAESFPLTLTVSEGPRFLCGLVEVLGASPAVNQWVASQLQVASTAKKDAKPVWEPGEPAVGTLFGSLHRRQSIQERLSELGLDGSEANIDFRRNESTHEQELVVHLAKTDALFMAPATAPEQAVVDDAEVVSSEKESDSVQADGIAGELHRIYQRLFAEPTAGLHFRSEEETITMDFWFGQEIAVAKLQQGAHSRQIVSADGQLLISMPTPPAAIQLPIPNPSLLLTQQSTDEAEDGKTFRITLGGAMSSKTPDQPVRVGFVFTRDAWKEWFPAQDTQRTESDGLIRYACQDRELVVDSQGRLIKLYGSRSGQQTMHFSEVSEQEIRQLADEIVATVQPLELFARHPDTNRRITLGEMLRAFSDEKAKQEKLHIPPAGGQQDVFGVLILAAVQDGRLVDPDSRIGNIAKLYALELSGNRRGLSQRIAEMEAEAGAGPFTSAALGDLLARQGDLDGSLRLLQRSQALLNDSTAVERDLRTIFDTSNLLGRVCENVDVKSWLQQTTQLAAPAMNAQLLALIQNLTAGMPDAENASERLANARRVMLFALELGGRSRFDQYLSAQIQTVEARKQRLAAKKEETSKK